MWLKSGGALALATLRVGSNRQPFEIKDVVCAQGLPVWSPSGDWIACAAAAGTVWVSPDGKVNRTLPPLNVPLAWSKDSRTLYGLKGENGISSLLAEDVQSGQIRKVADYGREFTPYSSRGPARSLSLSPDGKSFAIGTLKRQTSLWILEGSLK
jgi:Tol biopolymer transport system component